MTQRFTLQQLAPYARTICYVTIGGGALVGGILGVLFVEACRAYGRGPGAPS